MLVDSIGGEERLAEAFVNAALFGKLSELKSQFGILNGKLVATDPFKKQSQVNSKDLDDVVESLMDDLRPNKGYVPTFTLCTLDQIITKLSRIQNERHSNPHALSTLSKGDFNKLVNLLKTVFSDERAAEYNEKKSDTAPNSGLTIDIIANLQRTHDRLKEAHQADNRNLGA